MLNSCCGKLPLREGTIAIIVLHLVFVVLYWIYEWFVVSDQVNSQIIIYNAFKTFISLVIPFGALGGVLKKEIRGLIVFLIMFAAGLVYYGAVGAFLMVTCFTNPNNTSAVMHDYVMKTQPGHPKERIAIITVLYVYWTFSLYFVLVVYSFYKELKDEIASG